MGSATKLVTFDGPFRMHRAGGELQSPTLAYETWGELNAAKDNAILIFTGLSPSAHATSSAEDPSPGWWEDMIGSGLPLDTDRFFIICVNSLGSCFGSTGPASFDPETDKRYRLSFPVLTLEDVAEANRANAAVIVEELERLIEEVGAAPYVAVVDDPRGVILRFDSQVLFRSGDAKAKPQPKRKPDSDVRPEDAPRKDGVLSLGRPTVSGVRKLVDKL